MTDPSCLTAKEKEAGVFFHCLTRRFSFYRRTNTIDPVITEDFKPRAITSYLLVIFLGKTRIFTSVKIVNLPGYFTVINSCGKEGDEIKMPGAGFTG